MGNKPKVNYQPLYDAIKSSKEVPTWFTWGDEVLLLDSPSRVAFADAGFVRAKVRGGVVLAGIYEKDSCTFAGYSHTTRKIQIRDVLAWVVERHKSEN
jgi:hypothetical protein